MAINVLEAYEKEPPEPDFVLPGFLAGTVGILTSAGGVGKSFWMMEACHGVASPKANAALLNLPIKKHGAAIILNAEDHPDMLHRRLHSMGKLLDKDSRHEAATNLVVEPLFGHETDIMEPKWQDSILRLAERNNPRIIVLDTLSRWHRGEENSNAEMGRLMAILDSLARKTGAAILIVHHVSKAMAINGRQDEQQSVRGASLLVDNARWQAFMCGMTKEEAKMRKIDEDMRRYWVRFGISKQNNDKPFDDCWLRRGEGGVLLPDSTHENGSWK